MSKYLVERRLPGVTPDQLGAAAQAARNTALEFERRGVPVRYLRSTFIPSDERCYCLFEAESVEAVKEVNVSAGLPFEHVVPALHLAAEDLEQAGVVKDPGA